MSARFEETWFYAPAQSVGEEIRFSEEEAHHLRVLRVRPGTEIFVTNGEGSVFLARWESSGETASARILERVRHDPQRPPLGLALALLKGRDIEWPAEAACEFALGDLFLVQTDCSGEFERQGFDRLLERLRKKSLAALKQAKKSWLTRVHAPDDLRAWRARHSHIALAVAHPGRDDLPSPLPSPLHVLVGPEGGFSAAELEYLFGAENAYRLALGPTRLRAVHAAVAALGNLTARA